ncbi:MAG: 2'-5' RNA ligase family protein [Thermoleophilia bacterium]|nr:2'-5' RNA ligase family protein [Thermoleophilia bacterium]
MAAQENQTAVVVPVLSANTLIAEWLGRSEMPPHVTIVYPFLDRVLITDAIVDQLAGIFAKVPVIELELTRLERFPGVLYLVPEPVDVFRQLSMSVTDTWPEAPPYRGAFEGVTPHLTVTRSRQAQALDEVELEVLSRLPFTATLDVGWLMHFDGSKWLFDVALPFAAPVSADCH